MKPLLLFIPGIGGHPRFHSGLLDRIETHFDVRSAPHVDFFSTPCDAWSVHVDHWSRKLRTVWAEHETRARSTAPAPYVVGVSYGANIAYAMSQLGIHAGPVAAISYWRISPVLRASLRLATPFRRPLEKHVGRYLFRNSERGSTDYQKLAALRRELYDDDALVFARLTARLLSLRASPRPGPAGERTLLIYGRDDSAMRLGRTSSRSWPGPVRFVEGDHDIGLNGSVELVDVLTAHALSPA